ncbi:hypothetical protein [Tepidibacillus marianensis]|uniref:hypothetical protein n=1 Tax=Tepidibacillus marianensis TaxID=3131995 RepID=UPI0030CBB5C3
MMMFNQHKNHNRSFFWGIVAGMAGGIWATNKLMNRYNYHNDQNPDESMMNSDSDTTRQQEMHHQQNPVHHESHSNHEFHDLDNLGNQQKEALFDAFLNGSKEELLTKAKDIQ